eukprot:scaffold421188_cov47-Attheya_sp.AAC.11
MNTRAKTLQSQIDRCDYISHYYRTAEDSLIVERNHHGERGARIDKSSTISKIREGRHHE